MFLHCPRVQALFPQEHICLAHEGPARMDLTEHGGSLLLKIGDLKFKELSGPGEETGLFLEAELGSSEALLQEIKGFVAEQRLLPPFPAPSPAVDCLIQPILAACHVPGRQKFIFAEDSRLQARPGKAGVVNITVRGEFRVRTVPCQEGDLVIHLRPGDMALLLSCLRTWAGALSDSNAN